MYINAIVDKPLPNGCFKTFPDARCLLCTTPTRTVLKALSWVAPTSCRIDNCINLIGCKVFSKQYIGETGYLREESTTIALPKEPIIKESIREQFKMRGYQWEAMTVVVIDHNAHWTDKQARERYGCTDSNHSDLIA